MGRQETLLMPFDINEFVQHFAAYNERAAVDKFDVLVALPTTLINTSGSYGSRELSLQCESAEFPGVELIPIEYRHYGFVRRIPHHINYSPISLTFYCTGQMIEKSLFDAWINTCINVGGNSAGLINYRQDNQGNLQYEGTIQIRQYNQQGDTTYVVQAEECMPVSISSLPTNWSDDSTHRVTVTFVFTKWQSQLLQTSDLDLPINNFTNQLLNVGAQFLNGSSSTKQLSQIIGRNSLSNII